MLTPPSTASGVEGEDEDLARAAHRARSRTGDGGGANNQREPRSHDRAREVAGTEHALRAAAGRAARALRLRLRENHVLRGLRHRTRSRVCRGECRLLHGTARRARQARHAEDRPGKADRRSDDAQRNGPGCEAGRQPGVHHAPDRQDRRVLQALDREKRPAGSEDAALADGRSHCRRARRPRTSTWPRCGRRWTRPSIPPG